MRFLELMKILIYLDPILDESDYIKNILEYLETRNI